MTIDEDVGDEGLPAKSYSEISTRDYWRTAIKAKRLLESRAELICDRWALIQLYKDMGFDVRYYDMEGIYEYEVLVPIDS